MRQTATDLFGVYQDVPANMGTVNKGAAFFYFAKICRQQHSHDMAAVLLVSSVTKRERRQSLRIVDFFG